MRQVDEDRFAEFVRAQSASLFRTAFLMTGDYQRAEDVLQTTLVRLYQRWPRVVEMERPGRLRAQGAGQPGGLVVAQALLARVAARAARPARPGDRMEEMAEHERVWQAVLSAAAAPAGGDGAAVLRGPERGRDRPDPVHGAGHREEPCARGLAPAGRAAERNPSYRRRDPRRRRRHDLGRTTDQRGPSPRRRAHAAGGGPRRGAPPGAGQPAANRRPGRHRRRGGRRRGRDRDRGRPREHRAAATGGPAPERDGGARLPGHRRV